MLFRRYPALLAIDHEDGATWILGDDRRASDGFGARLSGLEEQNPSVPSIGAIEVDAAPAHRQAITRALDYIGMGEVYEVNVARRWSASFEGDALELWRAMRAASRVPLGMFLDGGDHAVLACTMERFIHWDAESKTLVTRPIKGTIRREATDDGASQRLRADPKEQAEHSMIVDLMRNDLGRVAEIGTVSVEAPLIVEPFTGLYHLVSTVSCVTRPRSPSKRSWTRPFPQGASLERRKFVRSRSSRSWSSIPVACTAVRSDSSTMMAVSLSPSRFAPQPSPATGSATGPAAGSSKQATRIARWLRPS